MMKPVRVAVVGAGAVGLSTAVRLQECIPGVQVTIIADRFSPDTTSDGAAGIFRPAVEKTPGVPLHILKGWVQESWDYYCALAVSQHASEAGAALISGFFFWPGPKPRPFLADYGYNFQEISSKDVNIFPGPHKFAWSWTTVLCESRRYLPYMTKKFLSKGGTIQQQRLNSLFDIGEDFDVIVNCAGLGNTSLTSDTALVPVRGHLIRVEAPWVKHFVYDSRDPVNDCYIIPGRDCVIVGGTRQSGDDDVTIRKEDRDAIWERACRILPSLKKGKIIEDWVGLRPFREPLRLEPELVECHTGRKLKVVHNYGHGAEGIGLSWGTACSAVRLVQQLLASSPSKL